ncbi:ASCH domain-containing protein [Ensifer sp. IC3342]|nr:ASCH domain-containing protein [Ensifer sp. BRP08]MCA1446154.1 ASCH domain-containing protein [Ensifer sp. IC3342]
MTAPLPEAYGDAVTFSFGDSPALADELLVLVVQGKKTATCGARRDFGDGKEPLPAVGRRDVVLDGAGRPAVVIETTEVAFRRFDEVDAAFAFDEGEGSRTLEEWREEHERYFRRNGGFAPDMELVCERFRVIEVLQR